MTRCVPSTENSRQGGTLSSFYTNNGIEDGDAYSLAFASTSGLQYCSGSCTNTGNQLQQRHLAIGPQFTPRLFVTEEGQELTSKYTQRGRDGKMGEMTDALIDHSVRAR